MISAQSTICAEKKKKRMFPAPRACSCLLHWAHRWAKRRGCTSDWMENCRPARGVTLAEEAKIKPRIPASRSVWEWRPAKAQRGCLVIYLLPIPHHQPLHAHHSCGKTQRTVVKSKMESCPLNPPVLWAYRGLKEKREPALLLSVSLHLLFCPEMNS